MRNASLARLLALVIPVLAWGFSSGAEPGTAPEGSCSAPLNDCACQITPSSTVSCSGCTVTIITPPAGLPSPALCTPPPFCAETEDNCTWSGTVSFTCGPIFRVKAFSLSAACGTNSQSTLPCGSPGSVILKIVCASCQEV